MLLILGIWIAVLPYLGFPIFWKNLLFVATGLSIVYFSYILYKEHKIITKQNKTVKKEFENFSENRELIEEQEEKYIENQNETENQ